MIYFLTTRINSASIQQYLAHRGAALCEILVPVTYEDFLTATDLPLGTYFFTDLELLTRDGKELATQRWQQLARHGCRLFNHPQRTMCRFELLRTLHERGINQANVYWAHETLAPKQFPVFIRNEHDHSGSRSVLLQNTHQLAGALQQLQRGGEALNDKLIVEFCDTANEEGVYRKYAAFIVGERIIARHLFFSRHWVVKKWDLIEEAYLREELDYVQTNPHQEQLRQLFALARVNYGRIDYSLLNGTIQVWEINTNPEIAGPGTGAGGARRPVHEFFTTQFQAILEEVNR